MRASWSIAAGKPADAPYPVMRERAMALLRDCGAAEVAHLGGDLLSHLVRTEEILREWAVADAVALAGLCHAAYGTDGFAPSLLPVADRARLADAVGPDAEALVYLYAGCDRSAVYPQLGRVEVQFRDRFTGDVRHLDWRRSADATWLTWFAELTAANELELIRSKVFTDPKVTAELAGLFDRLVPYAPARVGAAASEARAAGG